METLVSSNCLFIPRSILAWWKWHRIQLKSFDLLHNFISPHIPLIKSGSLSQAIQDCICIEWKPHYEFAVVFNIFLRGTVKNDSKIFHKLLARHLLVTGHVSVHFDFWTLSALRYLSRSVSQKSGGNPKSNEMGPASIYVTGYSERQAELRNR